MKKKAALGLAGIAAVAVIGGTWAYWSQDLTATNEFETGKFDSDIVEQFTPPAVGEWLPGVTTEKNVKVTNSGDVDMALIAEITQTWSKGDETLPIYIPVVKEDGTTGAQNAAIINWDDTNSKNMPNMAAVKMFSEPAEYLGIPTIVTDLNVAEAKDKWVLVGCNEDYSKLYFIYNGIVPAGEETPVLLNSVTLNPNLEAGVTEKHYSYDENGQKVEVTENQYNYDDAQYTMDIHVTTVQATGDAIREVLSVYEDNNEVVLEGTIDDFITANADQIRDAYLEATSSNAN